MALPDTTTLANGDPDLPDSRRGELPEALLCPPPAMAERPEVAVSLVNRENLEINSCLLPVLQNLSRSPGLTAGVDNHADVLEIALIRHDGLVDSIEFLIDAFAQQGVATILLSSLASRPRAHQCPASVLACLVNDDSAALELARLAQGLASNRDIAIALHGEQHAALTRLLLGRGFRIEHYPTEPRPIEARQQSAHPQLRVLGRGLLLDELTAQARTSVVVFADEKIADNATDWVVACDQTDAVERSDWFAAGAQAVFDSRDSLRDIVLQVSRLAIRAAQVKALWQDSYRDPLTGIPTMAYLYDSGSKMLASASRAGDTVVLAVIGIENLEQLLQSQVVTQRHEVVKAACFALSMELRRSDVIAQRNSNELVCLFACSDTSTVPGLLDGLTKLTSTAISQVLKGCEAPSVVAGAVLGSAAEHGEARSDYPVQLHAMLGRASMALLQTRLPENTGLVIL